MLFIIHVVFNCLCMVWFSCVYVLLFDYVDLARSPAACFGRCYDLRV